MSDPEVPGAGQRWTTARHAAMVSSDEAGREVWKPSAIPYEKVMTA
jgi:hypothetical protein